MKATKTEIAEGFILAGLEVAGVVTVALNLGHYAAVVGSLLTVSCIIGLKQLGAKMDYRSLVVRLLSSGAGPLAPEETRGPFPPEGSAGGKSYQAPKRTELS